MTSRLTIGLLVAAIPGARPLTLTAEAVLVLLDARATKVVAATADDDLTAKNTIYSIVMRSTTVAEIAMFGANVPAATPGRFVGWTVMDADEMPLWAP